MRVADQSFSDFLVGFYNELKEEIGEKHEGERDQSRQ